MNVRPKAIYIGDLRLEGVFKNLRPEWDFWPGVESVQDFWEMMDERKFDSPGVENDFQIILILDLLFDEKGVNVDFENLISQYGQYCFIGIISYKPNVRKAIADRVDYQASAVASVDPKFYFIEKSGTNPSIDTAISKFLREGPETATWAKSIISGKTEEDLDIPEQIQEPVSIFEDDEDENVNNYLGQIVAITSSKGGSGKSTVALTLATYLGHSSLNSFREGLVFEEGSPRRGEQVDRPLKVLVLDLDVRDGQIGFLIGQSNPNIIHVRLAGVSAESLQANIIHSDNLKIDLLLAAKRPKNADETPPDFYVEVLQLLRKTYDYVILDTSVNYLDPLLEKVAYPAADVIIFVTDIVVNSVFSMTRWIQEVTNPKEKNGMGIPRNKIGVVVNKVVGDVGMPKDKIAKSAMGLPILTTIPSNAKLVAHAANLQSMEFLLRHKDIRVFIRILAKAIVGKRWPLSQNVEP